MVLDCAAKFDGTSLNSNILPGPKLLNDLVEVLLRFRRYLVAIVGDVSEMFLQIGLDPDSRRFYRIVWEQQVLEYQRTIFGDTSSPFKANLVIREHSRKLKNQYPEAADTVENALYVDDAIDSRCSTGEAKKTRSEMTEMLDRGGMKMRKWLSNDPEVLEDVPQSDKATFLDINGKETLPCQKALGILWLAEEDVITVKPRLREGEYPATRRGMLRCIAALFDPLGLVDPFRIRVWILFQRTWIRKEDWDSPLEEDLALEWSLWKKVLPHLDNIRVSRHLGMNTSYQTELHVFSDASKDAFSAVVYARTLMTDGRILVRLVIAKTRLSPLKAISIARLELCGAVIGTRLVKKVIKPLESGRGAKQLMVTYWTDSMNVLFWICRPGKQFKLYVANRVGEIQERTSTDQWRHIPTKLNPADISSRGMAVEELARSQLWWEGPSFLKESESNWPEKNIAVPDETTDIEKTSTFAVQEAQPEQNETMMFHLHPSRWSDMGRLTRRIGFVRRIMMWLLKRPLPPGAKTWIDELSPEEYRQAEDCLSRQVQKDVFDRELKDLMAGKSLQKTSHLIPLSPYLDKERRLLRIKSRLERIDYISEEEKYPIIMPRKHPVSQLLVKRAHDAVGHPVGRDATMVELRRKYWVICTREAVRSWEMICSRCVLKTMCIVSKPASQQMAPIPQFRFSQPTRAFGKCGMDFAGPFLTKQGRGKIRNTRYLAVFTCLQTRAVYLEPVYQMDTDSFLMAFARMTSRRSVPEEVLTDNGSNFVAGERELRELVNAIDWTKVQQKTVGYQNTRGVTWHFNPPGSPHFGGVFEITRIFHATFAK
ncbi:uncharacterized protein LOC135494279 [Lineus longissimus]|uniref:uncharacterized protein LOC135494279 n=1 Tax=Lineus longissimus TaxID=88925 RepID=UPI00315C5165